MEQRKGGVVERGREREREKRGMRDKSDRSHTETRQRESDRLSNDDLGLFLCLNHFRMRNEKMELLLREEANTDWGLGSFRLPCES